MRCRNSHQSCSLRKGLPRNFPKFTGKYLYQSLFLLKLQTSACSFIKKEAMPQMFFCEISKKNFLQHVSGRLLLEVFYSRFKFKCSFLFRSFQHGSSSSFDKRQRYHELMGEESTSFIWCIKASMNFSGTKWIADTLSVNLFLEFEPELGKSQLNNLRMKENRAFISYSFLSRKKQ